MINRAEEEGRLQPGGTIYEGTAGNTGIALALVGVSRGYKVKVVMPDKMSAGKISHLKALGAEVVLTRSDVGRGHPQYYQDLARALAQEDPNGFFINQFENAANPTAHLETTGPEIWAQTEGNIDCFVAGIGSGGTVSGCGNYLREKNPDIELVLADPVGSILGAPDQRRKNHRSRVMAGGRGRGRLCAGYRRNLAPERSNHGGRQGILLGRTGIASRKASWAVHRRVCWWRRRSDGAEPKLNPKPA